MYGRPAPLCLLLFPFSCPAQWPVNETQCMRLTHGIGSIQTSHTHQVRSCAQLSNQLDSVVDSHGSDLYRLRIHANVATIILVDRLEDSQILGQISLSQGSHHTSLSGLF